MELNDLFVSYKLVDPVVFNFDNPDLPRNIYLNLGRAQQATSGTLETSDTKTFNEPELFNWKVSFKNGELEPEVIVPYREGVVPEKSLDSTTQPESKINSEDKKISSTLQKYRSRPDYLKFKLELNTFIRNNSLYASIKDSLDYLAALESKYIMNVENYLGSSALGWFLFMDSTRHAYNRLTRKDFANDAQALLLAAAKHYTALQKSIKNRGGDPNDFVTMYGAWWRPESAYAYIKDNTYDYVSDWNERFSDIRLRAKDLIG